MSKKCEKGVGSQPQQTQHSINDSIGTLIMQIKISKYVYNYGCKVDKVCWKSNNIHINTSNNYSVSSKELCCIYTIEQ
jgi:hypothetical protein